MLTVSSMVGCFTKTCWKRRSSALSCTLQTAHTQQQDQQCIQEWRIGSQCSINIQIILIGWLLHMLTCWTFRAASSCELMKVQARPSALLTTSIITCTAMVPAEDSLLYTSTRSNSWRLCLACNPNRAIIYMKHASESRPAQSLY